MSSWTDSRCGKQVPWGRAEHCTVCHESFSGSVTGDAHRVGSYEPDERRCLTRTEMLAKGWQLKVRSGGCKVWSGPAMSPEALAKMPWNAQPASPVEDSSHFQGSAGTSRPTRGFDVSQIATGSTSGDFYHFIDGGHDYRDIV